MVETASAKDSALHADVEAWLAADPAALGRRWELFRRLREHGPVYSVDSIVLVPRYADVKQVLLDPDHFLTGLGVRGSQVERDRELIREEHREVFDAFHEYESNLINRLNGDEHRRVRALAHAAFTPRRIKELEAVIESYLSGIVAGAGDADTVDFMPLAYQLPLIVIVDLLGFPRSDMDLFHRWTIPLSQKKGSHDPVLLRAAYDAATEFCAYVDERLSEHRRGIRQNELLDLMSRTATETDVAHIQVALMCIGLLTAGHETTMNLITSGLLEVLANREHWNQLRDEPGVVDGAVEELLRFVSPAQWMARVAQEGASIAGVEIEKDTSVYVLYASANRDPSVFRDPDRLDFRRGSAKDHLAFAVGPHFCIGAALARLEAKIVFRWLPAHFPEMQLAVDPAAVRWRGSTVLPTIESLPVRFGRGRGKTWAVPLESGPERRPT